MNFFKKNRNSRNESEYKSYKKLFESVEQRSKSYITQI